MELKHKAEWPQIVRLAELKCMDYENILLLLAIREAEDGKEGQEFNRLDAMGANLDAQTRAMINFIKEEDKSYQRYIKRCTDDPFTFIEYISDSTEKSKLIQEALDVIKKEFEARQQAEYYQQ